MNAEIERWNYIKKVAMVTSANKYVEYNWFESCYAVCLYFITRFFLYMSQNILICSILSDSRVPDTLGWNDRYLLKNYPQSLYYDVESETYFHTFDKCLICKYAFSFEKYYTIRFIILLQTSGESCVTNQNTLAHMCLFM